MDSLVRTSMRFELPRLPARAGWRINPGLFSDALNFLELRRFVAVRYSGAWQRVGTHYAKTKGYHGIVISQEIPLADANDTLWHELAHALQAESFEDRGGTFHRFYRECYVTGTGEWGATYRNNAFEIHARATATNRPFDIAEPTS